MHCGAGDSIFFYFLTRSRELHASERFDADNDEMLDVEKFINHSLRTLRDFLWIIGQNGADAAPSARRSRIIFREDRFSSARSS